MPIAIKSTGGGSVTVAAPNTASDFTVTYPATSGTMMVASGGSLPVAQGGTGSTTLTANNVLLGNGTSALQTVAPGASGQVLTSNGTTWVSQAPSGGGSGAAAWVNFNGTGTVAIRASSNVTSITDNGVGDYTVNFTTPLADANYAAVATGGSPGTGFVTISANTSGGSGTEVAPTSSAFRFNTGYGTGGGNVTDAKYAYVAFFR